MDSIILPIIIGVTSGAILLGIEYWFIKPLRNRQDNKNPYLPFSLYPLNNENKLSRASIVLSSIGLLGIIILSFSPFITGGEKFLVLLFFPTPIILILGLILGLISKKHSNELASAGIAISGLGIGIFLLLFIIIDNLYLWCTFFPSLGGC